MTRDDLMASLSEMVAALARGDLTVDAAAARCGDLSKQATSATGQAQLFGGGVEVPGRAKAFRDLYSALFRKERGFSPVFAAKENTAVKGIVKRCEQVASELQRPADDVMREWIAALFADEWLAGKAFDLGLARSQWDRIWSPSSGNGHRPPAPHAAFAGKGREL